jgi:F0F1-type ATP synthase assembly protein I
MSGAAPYLGLGMQLALTLVFFTGGGYALDRGLDTEPWLMLVGTVFGIIAIMIKLLRLAQQPLPSSAPPSDAEDES